MALLEGALGDAVDIACVRLPAPPAAARDPLKAFIHRAQRANVAVLIEDRLELVESFGADGLHLGEGADAVTGLRRALGPERSLGVACGLSRHAAMEAAEAGADYVSFAGDAEALIDTVDWWAEIMTVALVAEDVPTPDAAAALAAAGADFVGPRLSAALDEATALSLASFADAIRSAIGAPA